MSQAEETLANGVNRSSGIFGAAAAITIVEEGTSVGLKVVTKSVSYVNLAVTATIAYNEWATGRANTHTFTDVAATVLTVAGGAVALTFGVPVIAAGFAIGGATYGIGSIFFNESLDKVTSNWGNDFIYNR